MSRILLVTTIFPPQIGGPATFVDRLAHALQKAGHSPTVLCVSDRTRDVSDASRPFKVRRTSARYRVVQEARTYAALVREITRNSKILICGLDHEASTVAAFLRRPYVIRIGGDAVWEKARNTGLTALSAYEYQTQELPTAQLQTMRRQREAAVRRARLVVTPSKDLRTIVIGWGVDPGSAVTIENGVDLPSDVTGPARRVDPQLDVAFCGRLTNFKGVETVLLAVSGLDDVCLHIIGDGPEMPMLVELTQQLALENRVRFYGRLSAKKRDQTLSGMHALVLMSAFEGMPNVLVEACALGLPCIASNRGGNPEVIKHGVNGLLVEHGDVPGLKAALRSMRDDEDLRFRLAQNAIKESCRFDFQRAVDRYVRLLAGP